jgi:hypothetical protein
MKAQKQRHQPRDQATFLRFFVRYQSCSKLRHCYNCYKTRLTWDTNFGNLVIEIQEILNERRCAMKKSFVPVAAALLFAAGTLSAQTTFQAFLTGTGENPPNASPGTGIGTVVLNAAQNQITVDENWSGLTAPATASHIHGPGGAGTNAPVLFPFSGVPAATAGAIPEQMFSITPTQVGYLFAGYLYFNVHTSTFPGGEIRGQILLVPEPGRYVFIGIVVGVVVWRWRKSRQAALAEAQAIEP